MKRKLSVEWSCENLLKANEKVFFWTFTTFCEETPERMASMWDSFLKRLREKFGKFDFIRVIEPHKSGRRYHYHVLVNVFLDVHIVRRIGNRHGFGRMHVKLCYDLEGARYMSKYMAKAKRCDALKEVRLLSCSLRPATFIKVRIRDTEYRINGKTCAELYGPGLLLLPRFQRFAEVQLRSQLAASGAITVRDWMLSERDALRAGGYDVESEFVDDLVRNPWRRLEYVKGEA